MRGKPCLLLTPRRDGQAPEVNRVILLNVSVCLLLPQGLAGCALLGACGQYMCAILFAGHATITNYLLNYFPGLDLERRNIFGFTALMKAAMQGRTECIRALMLAGTSLPVLCGP